MNERIFDLAKQAGMRFGLSPAEQKFAELIAQECARLAMTQHCSTSPADYGDMEPYEQGCDDTASRISGLIRRTFGVKE
jgi:hypothetical protein